MSTTTYYLVADSEGCCFRTGSIETGTSWQRAETGTDLVSQNIWECAATPVLAIMKNPLHAEGPNPRLYAIKSRHKIRQNSLTRKLEIGMIPLPEVSPAQKLAFAMYVVRQLAPEHPFSHWAERWLSRVDRSATGARLAMRSLVETARKADISVAELARLGIKGRGMADFHIAKFDFLWRAYEVVEAAFLFIEKSGRWQFELAEKVSTVGRNALCEDQLVDLADLAMSVAAESTTSGHIASSLEWLRRPEAPEAGSARPALHATAEPGDSGRRIKPYGDTRAGRR